MLPLFLSFNFHLDNVGFLMQENAAQREKDDLVQEMKIMQVNYFAIVAIIIIVIVVIVNHIIIIVSPIHLVIITSTVIIGLTGSFVANPFEHNVYSCCLLRPH